MNFETVSSVRRITPDSEDDRRETSSLVRSGCETARIDSSDIERKKRCGRVVWSAIFDLFDWIRERKMRIDPREMEFGGETGEVKKCSKVRVYILVKR